MDERGKVVRCDGVGRKFGELDADVFIAGRGEGGAKVEIFDINGEPLLVI